MCLSIPSQPKIISRDEWNANPPKCNFNKQPYYNIITIHHTATSNNYNDSFKIVKSIQIYHQENNNWCDIGYHFLIDRWGNIFEGRPLWAVGAHVAKHNMGNIGISLIGNFEEQPPSNASIKALIDIISWLVYKYNISLNNIKGHRDFANTLCPGKYLYNLIPEIRRKVGSNVYGFGNGFGKAAWWGIYSDYWSSDRETWEKQVDDAFKKLSEIGIDTIFFLVKDPWGYAYYNSSILPLSHKYSWDPLKYIIDRARKYNISIYVYINVLAEGGTSPNKYLEENIWEAVRDSNNNVLGWIDPASENHLDRILKIVEEILEKYEIDGIQLDRIRLPSNAYILPLSEKKFKEKFGIDPSQDKMKWTYFKAEKITYIVKKIYEKVKSINPNVRVSAAVIPNHERAILVLGQDWSTWLKEKYVDFVAVMSYTSSSFSFKDYIRDAITASNNTRPIYMGIGIYMEDMGISDMGNEVKDAYKNEKVYGIVFFNVDTLIKDVNKYNSLKTILKNLPKEEKERGGINLIPIFVGIAAISIILFIVVKLFGKL